MKELRLLAIIICVLQSLDFVETIDCSHPFGTGTFISSTRGTWATTNTTIANYKFTIGSYTTTITLTCYSKFDTNRYIFYNYYQVFNNVFLNVYTCLDIRDSTYSNKYYFYEATELDTNSGDYFTADSTNVCNRANYLTAVETKVVIKQGTYDTNKIYCPNIILGNYTYNTTGDYSDMDSCNNTQQLTFKKNKATYVALSSLGNLRCMYSGTGTYVYLLTFNNETVDNTNTYQFTCFAFSFSGYGSVVYASQRPQSCSSSQTPISADSTAGKTFIFTPYVTCPINETSTESKAAENLGWVAGLVAAIVLVIITVIIIACFIFKKDKVSDNEPIIKQEEGRDGTPTPSPPPSLDRGMTQFDLRIETPSVLSFKGQDDKVDNKIVGGGEPLLEEDEVIDWISGEPLPEDKEVINSIHRDTLPEGKEVAKMRGGEPLLEDGDNKLKEDIEVKSITGDEIPQDSILEPGKRIIEEVEEEAIPERSDGDSLTYEDAEDSSEESEEDFIITRSRQNQLDMIEWKPRDLEGIKTVGKKRKGRINEDQSELTKELKTREELELQDMKIRDPDNYKKMKKYMKSQKYESDAHDKLDNEDVESGLKKGGRSAPFIIQYHHKKYLDDVLDEEEKLKNKAKEVPEYEDDVIEESEKEKTKAFEEDKDHDDKGETEENDFKTAKEVIMQEEDLTMNQDDALGIFGLDGPLPPGYTSDKDGNIIREKDGSVVVTAQKKHELRNKIHHLFNVPRLIRDDRGRPVGGFKNDEFGPTAEWITDEPINENEEVPRKQLHLSREGSMRSRGTPLKNVGWEDKSDIIGSYVDEYAGRRGKENLASARELLRQRLAQPKKVRPGKEKMRPRRCKALDTNIYLPSGNIAEEEEKEKNRSLSPQEGRVLIARAKSVGSAEKERRVNRRPLRVRPYDPRGILPVGGIPEETGSETDDANRMERTLNGPRDPGTSPAFYPRYDKGHNGQPTRESTMLTDASLYSMLTADLNDQDVSDRDLKRLLEELYVDKKYFDYYLQSEAVPTHAGVHTRSLAQSGRGFLLNRADFWHERNPVPPRPPTSELGMRMSRMQTIYTIADSGRATMTSPTTERPYSADDLNLAERDNVRRLNEENSMPSSINNTHRSAQTPDRGHIRRLQHENSMHNSGSNTGNNAIRSGRSPAKQTTNCSFPASIEGTWFSSSHGTWVANASRIYGMDFKIRNYNTGPSGLNYTFSCYENRYGNLYTIASDTKFEVFSGILITLYTCIDLREISSAKFVYYIARDIFTGNKIFESICDSSDYNASYAHHVLVRNGSESDAFILCPPSIYGTYSYNDSCKEPMYNTTSVSVCTTRQEIVFNYNACSTPIMYSQEGILDCVYSITNGSTSYLTVYNSDSTTPNEVDYYRFSCIVLEEINNIVYLTVNPQGCEASQNTTFASTGQAMVWRPYELCPIKLDEKQEDLIWIAIVVGIVVGLIVLIIITFAIICCTRRIRLRKVDEEQPITDETSSDESSIDTEYGNEERKSLDSGISEPTNSRRGKEEKSTVGEIYIDDNSHPTPIKIDSDGSSEHENEEKGAEDDNQESKGSRERILHDSDEENLTPEQSISQMRKEDGEIYQLKGSLTTTLMSREDEERKRKRKSKDKKRKLRKKGKNKQKYKNDREVGAGKEGQEKGDSESGSSNSENEGRRTDGAVIAPFTTQYKYKKHMEHILKEEYNLTEEDNKDKTNILNELDTLSTSTSIGNLVSEEEVIWPDSKNKRPGSDTDSDSAMIYADDLTKQVSDVDDTVKRNNKQIGTNREKETKEKLDNDKAYFKDNTPKSKLQDPNKKTITNPTLKGLTVIHVKEIKQGDKTDNDIMGTENFSGESFSTETDSGVEDEEELYLDVQLTKDQQDFIYKSLHDEHNNLRPVFERNKEGKIIRKSDGAIVFDPDTGKVRIRKQIGNIFNIPRLKRNRKGRLIGGYHDDQFGPTKQKEEETELTTLDGSVDTNSINGKRSWSSKRNSSAQSADNRKKGDTTRTKTVAFGVGDEVEVVQMDNSESSELRTKGRRDITSAIRRKLRDRLFRKRKKRGGGMPNDLFINRKPKKAWMQSSSYTIHDTTESGEGHGIGGRNIQLKPLARMQGLESPQWSLDTPLRSSGRHSTVLFNRSVAGGSLDQNYKTMFQQGLETDRKVIHRLTKQTLDKMRSGQNTNSDVSYQAAGEINEDLNKNGHFGDSGSDSSLFEEENNGIESPVFRSTGHRSTRLYDDYRLRILLEELFRDKKYFDHFIQTTDPNSDVLMQTKDIAENGRDFLLERAEFWEARGPIPPRPPLTRYGFYMSRAHTSYQDDMNATSTITPIPRSHTMPVNLPGYVIHSQQMNNENVQETEHGSTNEHESYV
ncbi:hypothetical protein ACJMK2_032611 [Sinanodonta woodiana]|uniref:DUF7042 domain-containing protein n=1 Tax=Sinanodonta woodiana TaxID=1069815 RepID=A0ABD3X293_SINWO